MREEEFNRRAKSGHFRMGKERACSSSRCHDVSSLGGSELSCRCLRLDLQFRSAKAGGGKGRKETDHVWQVVVKEKKNDQESTRSTVERE